MRANGFLDRSGLGRPELRAWAMYDWANSGYATVITAAILPPFFATYYAAGMEPSRATTVYGLVISISVFISAVLAPILGTLADVRRAKKSMLAFFTALGALAVVLFFFTGQGQWRLAACWAVLGSVGFSASLVFYDGLLPGIAREEEFDRVSAAGFALGYIGGGLLLALNTAWLLYPDVFGFADQVQATRWALLSVAVWWVLFSVPLLLRVPEPMDTPRVDAGAYVGAACRRLLNTFREIRAYRDLFVFLIAFWLYNDGIGTIIKMATIFGSEIGIELHHLVLALLITQFVAFPFSLLFGQLGARIGPRKGITICLWVYTGIACLGYLMQHTWQFYALAILVGTVQGGVQALSRSMFARMVPKHCAGEFFGFYSVSSKFATVLGPALFAGISYLTGASRLAVLMIAAFFVGGMLILRHVDLERGERHARRVEQGATG